MSQLKSLTEGQKQKAFMHACQDSTLTEGRLVRVTEEHYEMVLDFFRDNYVQDEPALKATGVKWRKQIRELTLAALRQNLGIMIIDDSTGDVMAVIISEVVGKESIGVNIEIEDPSFKDFVTFWQFCEQQGNLFEHFKVDEAVRLISLGTNKKYRNRGLATDVARVSLAMIRAFDVGPVCVKCECSSVFSQKMCEAAGMQCLYVGTYADYKVDGKIVFGDTGIHKSLNIYGMIV